MKDKGHLGHKHCIEDNGVASPKHQSPKRWTLSYWIMGIGSLFWLLWRSGTKPRRLTYPCQRVAAANSLGFLAYLSTLLGSATLLRRLKAAFSPALLILFIGGLVLTVFLQGSVASPPMPVLAESPDLPDWTSPGAISDVFAVTDVPEPQYSLNGGDIPSGVSVTDALHDTGVDALINLMEAHGDYFYQTSSEPDGLFGANDVIVIKINNQWGDRNSTNTDVVKGVIYRLVSHPSGFTGAVIIAENAQGANPGLMQESKNNSQFQDQSYQEVADVFADQGYHVCTSVWDDFRTHIVDDYDEGDTADGYVLLDADSTVEEDGHGRLSYPKFQVNCNGMNLSVSMRQGIWSGAAFDSDRLKMVNLPVLKRHQGAGATAAVKNYLGFITICSGSECSVNTPRWVDPSSKHCWMVGLAFDSQSCSSYTVEYGLIARQMAQIRRADLNIVDAIWVNPKNNAGWTGSAIRQDVLLASRDPFAVDYYASEYILGPLIQQYYPSDPYTEAIASASGGKFRTQLLYNAARLRHEGISDAIMMDDSMNRNEELAQFNVYVADANEPLERTLTLEMPNGGERWTIGDQEQIRWSSTGDVGDVDLEYSIDGFSTSHPIVDSTLNDGAYTWTIPNDPSEDVLVRVSSALDPSISDTSDAPFAIAGPHDFEDSFKQVSRVRVEGGETIGYTIVLYEGIAAEMTFNDAIPYPYTYVPDSVAIEPAWKGPVQDANGIQWSGDVTSTVPVTITFQVQVPVTSATLAVINRAQVSRDGGAPVELTALSIINSFDTYLPILLKH